MVNNKERLIKVATKLDQLRDKLVFVGGGIIWLLLDPDYLLPPRPSYDVDTIVEIYGLVAFNKLNEQLRSLGFKHNITDNVICRWEIDGIPVDVMPTDPNILGFSNKWYQAAAHAAQTYSLAKELNILLISAPYFLATKIEAFKSRGRQDFFGSHDFEDLITIFDGRKNLIAEISQASSELQIYLKEQFAEFLSNDNFHLALPGHLAPYGTLATARAEEVTKLLKKLIA